MAVVLFSTKSKIWLQNFLKNKACQVQSGMPGSPVAVLAGAYLTTWPTTAVSCLTVLGTLCGQLTFRLAWCREHSVVMATELMQPWNLTCGTLFQSSCIILTSPMDCSENSWRDTFFGKHEHGSLLQFVNADWLWIRDCSSAAVADVGLWPGIMDWCGLKIPQSSHLWL